MKKRTVNFDLLRITAMLMIVYLHCFGSGHGNIINKIVTGSAMWYLGWIVQAFCCVAVNCYILISGYFLTSSSGKIEKIKSLCFTIWFYSITIFCIHAIWHRSVTLSDIRVSLLPILNRTYWFASVYVGLYLLTPYLFVLVSNITKEVYRKMLITLFFLFSIIATIYPFSDPFSIGGGQGLLWMMTVYLTGAYIRKYEEDFSCYTAKTWFLLYCGCVICIAFSKILIGYITTELIGKPTGTSILYSYNSPFCLLASICLFIFFKKITLKNERNNNYVLKVSSTTFGVYLVHDNPYVRKIIGELVEINLEWNIVYFILYLLFLVISIFTLCSCVEMVRQFIFKQIIIIVRGRHLDEWT